MVKKLVTIDVNDKELTVSAKAVDKKTAKIAESTEMEKLGFVEINKTASVSKAKNVAKGFEKNLGEATKRNIKAQTSQVEDYFDFSFRKNEKINDVKEEVVEKKETKTTTRKTATKTTTAKKSEKVTKKVEKNAEVVVKIDENLKLEQTTNVANTVNFDNEVKQIIRVARIGSLFDCDKRAIQA